LFECDAVDGLIAAVTVEEYKILEAVSLDGSYYIQNIPQIGLVPQTQRSRKIQMVA
jgi:hypothetical protein